MEGATEHLTEINYDPLVLKYHNALRQAGAGSCENTQVSLYSRVSMLSGFPRNDSFDYNKVQTDLRGRWLNIDPRAEGINRTYPSIIATR